MVNASLNWASIVGIVLAVGGAFLYFMRSFKPALARDYDVFFAAVGLLCGGILFFQGWRLDPILQFGQFLLAGTTVFFAYESVRLRGVTTEQARRSSYFDDDEPMPSRPRVGGRPGWDDDVERFEEPQPLRRRIRSPINEEADDEPGFYRPRREAARPAIPERAASRRPATDSDWDTPETSPRGEPDAYSSRRAGVSSTAPSSTAPSGPAFGSRRRERDSGIEPRRGSRPVPSVETMPRSSRRPGPAGATDPASSTPPGVPQGTPIRSRPTTSATNNPGSSSAPTGTPGSPVSDADYTPLRPTPSSSRPRDNSSRFDS